jgi:hypothetical protein
MGEYSKQKGGAYSTWDSDEENSRFDEYDKKRKEYEAKHKREIKDNLKNNPEEFKKAMDQLYNIPIHERFSGMGTKKKYSKKKKPKKKKPKKKKPSKKKKATKFSNHSKKQGGGKSRKPKKSKQTRRRPKRSRLSNSSKLAGYNPYPFGSYK